MEFNRRGFLAAILGGATLASAGASFGAIPDRYKVLIKLQQQVVDDTASYNAVIAAAATPEVPNVMTLPNYTTMTREELLAYKVHTDAYGMRRYEAAKRNTNLRDDISKTTDLVFAYMFNNFNGSDLDDPQIRQQIRDLYDRKISVDTMDDNDLRRTEDAVVVVAVMKYLISTIKAPVDIMKMDSMRTFVVHYRNLILV